MGCRGQVRIKDSYGNSVFLYTHWGACELKEDVALALARRKRWTDSEYLTRIIFDQMKGNDLGHLSFGIGTTEHGDIEELIYVDIEKQEIVVINTTWIKKTKGSITDWWRESETYSFEEYLDKHNAFIDECIAKNELFIKGEE
jgi:hypothetical protein